MENTFRDSPVIQSPTVNGFVRGQTTIERTPAPVSSDGTAWRPLTKRFGLPVPAPVVSGGSGGSGSGGSGGKNTDDFQTLADAFSHALSMQPVSTQDATPTVIMDPNAQGSGNGMNIKAILILLGVAGLAWFAWKKWGSKAVASAAA